MTPSWTIGSRIPGATGLLTRARPDWPSRVDLQLADGVGPDEVERWVQSACVLCANGCGLDIAVKDGRTVGVRGREVDRINKGRLGPKGLFGWQPNNAEDRLLQRGT